MELSAHLRDVAERARVFGEALDLPAAVRDAVEQAAAFHDLGKLDPRFQAMLAGGDTAAARLASTPLAKSGMDPADRAALRQARLRSGYPRGMRHEARSAAAVAASFEAETPAEADLIIHLVASHHGRSRPLMPPVEDPDPREFEVGVAGRRVMVDSGRTVDWRAPARLESLNRRFGAWGLALLETVVRPADIACSEEGR